MINIFIDSTTFGHAMGASFDFSREGNLVNKRINALEDCEVQPVLYSREIDQEKLNALIKTRDTKKINAVTEAIDTENMRVNSLAMLLKQLELVSTLPDNETMLVYVPDQLLGELTYGRYKFYLNENASVTTYYSQFELDLWRKVNEYIALMYSRLVFKSIKSCKDNRGNSEVQAFRNTIYTSMYANLLKVYRAERARLRDDSKPATNVTAVNEDIFGAVNTNTAPPATGTDDIPF